MTRGILSLPQRLIARTGVGELRPWAGRRFVTPVNNNVIITKQIYEIN